MSDAIMGIQNELSKGFLSLSDDYTDNMYNIENNNMIHHKEEHGNQFIEDIQSVGSAIGYGITHPIETLKNTGVAAYDATKTVGSAIVNTVANPIESIKKVGEVASDVITGGASVVGNTAGNVYNGFVGASQNQLHTNVFEDDSQSVWKKIIKWIILLLVLILVGVVIYVTLIRYKLVGNALSNNDSLMAAALLSPELSSGLTTLAAAL